MVTGPCGIVSQQAIYECAISNTEYQIRDQYLFNLQRTWMECNVSTILFILFSYNDLSHVWISFLIVLIFFLNIVSAVKLFLYVKTSGFTLG